MVPKELQVQEPIPTAVTEVCVAFRTDHVITATIPLDKNLKIQKLTHFIPMHYSTLHYINLLATLYDLLSYIYKLLLMHVHCICMYIVVVVFSMFDVCTKI